MHIPTGMLCAEVIAGTGVFSFGSLCYAVMRVWTKISREKLVLFSIISLLIFILQMGDFPILGSSGHVLGGAMAGIVLGPWLGFLSMSLVIAVQAVFFNDGGILALGANIFNMAFIGAIGGWFFYIRLKDWIGTGLAGFLTAWFYAVIASLAFVIEVWISGLASFLSLFLMVQVHALVGVVEGVMTIAILKSQPVLEEVVDHVLKKENT
ncbi:MAG: energy-coupling factor ABC transporter permease [Candidatus Margulisiibacteriota bacterium]